MKLRTLGIIAALVPLAVVACGDNQTHPGPAAYDAGTPGALGCVPNLDGRIDRAELGAALGINEHFLVSAAGTTRNVNLGGVVGSSGKRVWDWSESEATDQLATISASALAGKWYEASFPGAAFVSNFDAGGTLEAVYSEDDSAIYLHGLASTQQDAPGGKTLMVYDTPITLYTFPIAPGSTHTSTGTVKNATLKGLPYAGKDTYEVTVDASGELRLPDVTFAQAMRVRTNVTVEPSAGQATSQKQVSFLFECFGEVARATSQPGETTADFTSAYEVRRLGLATR